MKKQEFAKMKRLLNFFDNLKHSNIQIIGGARRRRTTARNWKLMWTNNEGKLPQSGKGNGLPGSPGAQRVPKKLDPKRNTPRHIIITLPKIKDKARILKAARGKERFTYKGVPIRLSADFSKETSQARRGWKEVLEVMKGKDLHPRLLYPAKLSFRMEGQTNCFPDKVKFKEFIFTKPLLYDLSKKKIIKIVNNKMTTNSQLSTTEPKKKTKNLSKQLQ